MNNILWGLYKLVTLKSSKKSIITSWLKQQNKPLGLPEANNNSITDVDISFRSEIGVGMIL